MGARFAGPAALAALVAAGAAGAEEDAAARGELVFHAGGCASCHSAEGGPPLAGGEPFETPFGTFHGPNITPDPETGIGGWSFEDFERAMREGLSPGGRPYYPAFPYMSYTRMTDGDLGDLWDYLQTVEPVRQEGRPHALGFPYNIRVGLWPWRWLFFEPGRLEPDPGRPPEWNRGAYLVRALGHCGECHTPRNWAGVPDGERELAGNPDGPEDERIPNITPDPETGIGRWGPSEIVFFLRLGMAPDGDFVGGSMSAVVKNSTSNLPDEDLQAIVAYLRSLPPVRDGLGR